MAQIVIIASTRNKVILGSEASTLLAVTEDAMNTVSSVVTPVIIEKTENKVIVERRSGSILLVNPYSLGSQEGSSGYNFLEAQSSATNGLTNDSHVLVSGKTMRCYGVDIDTPAITINGEVVDSLQYDGAVYSFSASIDLEEGENNIIVVSNNGVELTKSLTVTRATRPSISGISVTYPADQNSLKYGDEAIITITASGYTDISINLPASCEVTSGVGGAVETVSYTGSGTYDFSVNSSVAIFNTANDTSEAESFSLALNDTIPTCALSIKKDGESSYTTSPVLPAGVHTLRCLSNVPLTSSPTMYVSVGILGAFIGSGQTWTASLVIPVGDPLTGTGEFSNIAMTGTSGVTGTVATGKTFSFDKIDPEILSLTSSTHLWYPSDDNIILTATVLDISDIKTATVNLSAFGGSSHAAMTINSNNLTLSFKPNSADVSLRALTATVTDFAGNISSFTGDSLRTVLYKNVPVDLTFPPYTDTTIELPASALFFIKRNVHVEWGSTYTRSGTLTYLTDYTIVDDSKIKLTALWINDVQSNSLGKIYITCWES